MLCHVCDGQTEYKVGPGRIREVPAGRAKEIPSDFPVLTCLECGETYLTTTEAEKLETAT